MLFCIIVFLLPISKVAAWGPAIVEVDLVFPRPNQTYKPPLNGPFPIIYAIRNASEQWHPDPQARDIRMMLSWSLNEFKDTYKKSYPGNTYTTDLLKDVSAPLDTLKSPPPEPLIMIDAANSAGLKDGEYVLVHEFYLGRNCSHNGPVPPFEDTNRHQYFHSSSITFKIDTVNGQYINPSMWSAGRCPHPVAAINVNETRYDLENGYCSVIKEPAQEPNPCGLILDPSVATQVEYRMIDMMREHCDDKTIKFSWPLPEGKDMSCKASGSSGLSAAVLEKALPLILISVSFASFLLVA